MNYHQVLNKCNTTDDTSGAGTATLPEYTSLSSCLNGVHVTQPLVLCLVVSNLCFSFCLPFSFDYCFVYSTSIIWLSVCDLQPFHIKEYQIYEKTNALHLKYI